MITNARLVARAKHLSELYRLCLDLNKYPRVVPYLGWVGEDNLGDDAIFAAHAHEHPSTEFVALPRRDLGRTLRRVSLGLRRHPSALLLGGGTVIGRRECAEPLRAVIAAWPHCKLLMLGAGVEDPDFSGSRNYTDRDDLLEWASLLARFAEVTVRGPRSQALLRQVGVESEVVGDPALLLPTPPPGVTDMRLVAVNVSAPEDAWGGTLVDAHRTLGMALKTLSREEGLRFRLVVFHPADVAPTIKLRRELGDAAHVVWPATPTEAVLALRDCALIVGERLHSLVLSSVAGIPSLAIAYRPKCLDYQASVGLERFTIRSDRVTEAGIAAMLMTVLRDRQSLAGRLSVDVERLRLALRAADGRNWQRLAGGAG